MHHLRLLVCASSLVWIAGCPSQPSEPNDSGARVDSGGGAHDTGTDANSDGGAHDTGAALDMGAAVDTGAAIDTGAVSDTGVDMGSASDAAMASDAGSDAATTGADAGNPCANAGGRCVALAPGSCPGGTVGPESCGTGLGIECCHAGATDAGTDAATATDGGNACVNAGGMCVPLVPGSCTGGTVGPESCGTGLGVECCHAATSAGMPSCMMTGTAQEGWYYPDGTLICLNACAGLTATCEFVGGAQQGWYSTTGHGCMGHVREIVNDRTCT